MREAIGSAFIVNLILIFIGVISALVIGSISYSKAYKVKDRIIYIIEKYDGFTTCNAAKNEKCAETEINKQLKSIGYKVDSGYNSKCESIYKKRYGSSYDAKKLLHGSNLGKSQYNYCVYEIQSGIGTYYSVTSFMHFDIPLIGGFLEFPINGETSVIYKAIDN